MSTSTKTYTQEDIRNMAKGIVEPHIKALDGLMLKLPDAARPEILVLKNALNDQLEKMRPTDMVPAAQEANWALERLSGLCASLSDTVKNVLDRLAGQTVELCSYTDKTAKGELLAKPAVESLVQVARDEERKKLEPEIAAMRKSSIELCGLPAAPDAVMALPAADYTSRMTDATANVADMGKRGYKLGGKGDGFVKQYAWQTAKEFAGTMETLKDLLGEPAKKEEPLLGGGNQQRQDTGKTSVLGAC